MHELDHQRKYWNRVASSARFTHPVNQNWVQTYCRKQDAILDYGCGYGRTLLQLENVGYKDLTGIDTSEQMIGRAGRSLRTARLHCLRALPTPFPRESFALVFLFAVLTGVPRDEGQVAILDEIRRLLSPGGVLYLSDYLLQSDPDRVERYDSLDPTEFVYGTFSLSDGHAMMRHHRLEWLQELLLPLEIIERRIIRVRTMSGRPVNSFQVIARASRFAPTVGGLE